jgi:hypothetical protein
MTWHTAIVEIQKQYIDNFFPVDTTTTNRVSSAKSLIEKWRRSSAESRGAKVHPHGKDQIQIPRHLNPFHVLSLSHFLSLRLRYSKPYHAPSIACIQQPDANACGIKDPVPTFHLNAPDHQKASQ